MGHFDPKCEFGTAFAQGEITAGYFVCGQTSEFGKTDRVNLKYPVYLTKAQRRKIKEWLSGKKLKRREAIRAKVLLHSDRSGGRRAKECAEIGQSLRISRATVTNIRRSFYEVGLKKTIVRLHRSRAPSVMTGEVVAILRHLLLQSPPSNKTRWSVRTLAAALKELGHSVTPMTVCRAVGKERLMRTDRLDTQSFRRAVKRVLASPCDPGDNRWTVASLRRRLLSMGLAPTCSYTHFNQVIQRRGLDPADLEKSAKQP